MGGVISAIRKELNAADDEIKQMCKENLRQLEETGWKICDGFRLQVEASYKNPEEYTKWKVVGGRMDRESTFIGVATSTKPSTDITNGVQSMISGIFEAINKDKSSESFQTSISSMITGAFNAFLGNASAGSSNMSKFLIVPYGYAFYRIDISMYKYTFESKGFTDHYESITVVYASRGILAIKDLRIEDLLAYVGDICGNDQAAMTKWMNDFQAMYKIAQDMIAASGGTKPRLHRVASPVVAALKKQAPGMFSLPGPESEAASSTSGTTQSAGKRSKR